MLAAKGMVDARQKRGTFVRPRADWNLLDGDVLRWQFAEGADPRLLDKLHEVRGIIEPAAARLAADRATDDDLAALDGALDEMAGADGDPPPPSRPTSNFHRALLAATHNELLERMEVVIETGLAERDRLVHGGPSRTTTRCPATEPWSTPIRAQDADRRRDRHARAAGQGRPGRREGTPTEGQPVKIDRIETFLVPPRWLFCRMETDEGWSAGASRSSRAAPRSSAARSRCWPSTSSARTRCASRTTGRC